MSVVLEIALSAAMSALVPFELTFEICPEEVIFMSVGSYVHTILRGIEADESDGAKEVDLHLMSEIVDGHQLYR